ncbi:unnamed protein product [Calicophoron daubneyi]|uniref:Calpain-B n=1 Tax=Calicophoron daubneyi TaxID=300641 RepID=A0AAV2TAZ3_CALDB
MLRRPNLNMNLDRRSEYESARLRRQLDGLTVMQARVHKSTSLESSCEWYARQVHNQMVLQELFRDPFMPANDSSICGPQARSSSSYQWLRPHELTSDPKFIIDGISRFDVEQGEIGDCWLLAALSSLSMHPELLEKVVPPGQSFESSPERSGRSFPYCGMFWFRFWQFGDWVDVVVDDQLPTRNGGLAFMHSSNRNEFWSALLEKAYAKLAGSYQALRGGSTAEAMEDFTGGLTELVNLGEQTPPKLFTIMQRAHSRSSLMACSIDAPPGQIEAEGDMGLIVGHAYAVTDVRQIKHVHSANPIPRVDLVRLRNPWGNDKEWYGPWSDKSKEWRSVSAIERERIGLVFDNDGEFWMSFEDFVRYFSHVEFCHLGPETAEFGRSTVMSSRTRRRWEMTREEGEWVRYATAGGCRNFINTFHLNPQYRVQVIDPDENDDDNTGTIIVGLMQKGRRQAFQEPHTIGYAIYRLTNKLRDERILGKTFFLKNSSVTRSPAFINTREICGRHKLIPGEYVIIPSTFEPNQEAKFLLRIFSERACESNVLDEATDIVIDRSLIPSKPEAEAILTAKLHDAFNKVSGNSGEIGATELRDILNAAFTKDIPFDGFSRETARSMIALMDTDLNGTLDFPEFKKLWSDLRLWQTIFKEYDRDKSGTFDAFELRCLMRSLGFRVSTRVLNAIVSRYSTPDGRIYFDDYILLLVRLATVFDTYNAQEQLTDGRAAFELEDFMRSVIYI